MQEIWKNVKGYEGLYEVSNLGKIKNIKTEKIRKTEKNRYGYIMVNLYKNWVSKLLSVHRIVAKAFITNDNNLPQVNHKDGNKENNSVR